MRVVQHVFRRGAVYWWRRRLLKKTGERELAPVAISLRTRDPSKARTIAAHLAVASDGILRQEGREVLSPVQVRSMLGSVARTHLAKLDRLAALETADGITADDGRSSDRIMGWARRLQASQGIAATVGEAARIGPVRICAGGCPAMRIPTAVLGHSREIQSLSSPGPACALTQAIARAASSSGVA